MLIWSKVAVAENAITWIGTALLIWALKLEKGIVRSDGGSARRWHLRGLLRSSLLRRRNRPRQREADNGRSVRRQTFFGPRGIAGESSR